MYGSGSCIYFHISSTLSNVHCDRTLLVFLSTLPLQGLFFSFPFSSDCFQSTYILSCLSAFLPVCFIMDLYNNNNNNRERNTKMKENSKKQRTDWSIDWLTTVNSSISTYPAVSCVRACFYSIDVGASELLARLSPCLVYAAECHRSVVLLWLLSRFGIFLLPLKPLRPLGFNPCPVLWKKHRLIPALTHTV